MMSIKSANSSNTWRQFSDALWHCAVIITTDLLCAVFHRVAKWSQTLWLSVSCSASTLASLQHSPKPHTDTHTHTHNHTHTNTHTRTQTHSLLLFCPPYLLFLM